MKKYDVIVIGSGIPGMTIANKCTQKGLKTAVTDSRPYGGTSALRGFELHIKMSLVPPPAKIKNTVSYEI